MAAPLLYQELVLSGDKVSSGNFADVPPALLGQYDEFTIYVQFGAGTSAGKFQIRTSFAWPISQGGGFPYDGSYEPELASLVWATVGNTIDWAAASTQKYASVTGVFSRLRVYIDTTIVGGAVRVGIVCSSKN